MRELLAKHHVTQMTMKPVKRQYAFENTAVPHGTQWVLKVGCRAVVAPVVARVGVFRMAAGRRWAGFTEQAAKRQVGPPAG